MRFLAPIAVLICALSAAAGAAVAISAGMVPSADEKPFDGAASEATDTLFDCYHRQLLDNPLMRPGPPHITRGANGLILRADYTWQHGGGRLACSLASSVTENRIILPPLDPIIDPGTGRAFADWKARRAAEERRIATIGQRPAPDADTIRYLEGIWQERDDPGGVSCRAYSGYQTQYEFEFARSGGRLLIFEPPDLFTPVQIAGISRDGDTLTVQGRARDGSSKDLMRLKILDDRHFQTVPAPGRFPQERPQIATRCDDPDRAVTAGVSAAQLAAIAPPVSGGWGYPEAVDGVPDGDVCQGKGLSDTQRHNRASIQFELYGPVHYWIIAWNIRHGQRMLVYDYVRSVTAAGEHVLKLQMQGHLEKGHGWDVPESRGETYEITVIDHGDRIEIPEFHKTFIRCDATNSLGMHRW